jgi:Flp pilus assembly protein TadB
MKKMIEKNANFFTMPETWVLLSFVLLGILMVVFGLLKERTDRKKSVLGDLLKESRGERKGIIDKVLDRIPYIVEREKKLDAQISVLNVKYKARMFTYLELLGVVTALVISIYLRNWFILIPMVVIGFIVPVSFVEIKIKKKFKLFDDQILEAFQLFITEYTTTGNVQKTIANISPNIKYPLRNEFERLGRKLNSGEPVENCFMDFARRTNNRWTMVFAQMMITYFRTGGDFIPHLYSITESINNEKILAEQNSTELSSLRIVNMVLNALVPVAFVISRVINPEDTEVFTTTFAGKAIIFGVVVGCLISLVVGKKITDS